MEIKSFDSIEVIEILSKAFGDNTLVPIIGAGFTLGCRTESGKMVPSGNDFKKIMIKELKNSGAFTDEELNELREAKFSSVSGLFFDESYVPLSRSKEILKIFFKGVALDESRKSFLKNVNWPYIYTLNIDDAIEKCAKFNVVLPFEEVGSNSRANKSLFKMHGDINFEINHDSSKVIFSSSQYLKSIEKNKHMLSILKTDFSNKNILYVGCSLDDELEFSFISANSDMKKATGTRNIIFTCEELNLVRKQDLKNHGIDLVITYDKNQHYQIYRTIYTAYGKSLEKNPEFVEFKSKITRLDDSYEENRDFLINGISKIKSKDDDRIIPYYAARRKIHDLVLNKIKNNRLVIIKGKKFTGKTQFLYSLVESLPEKETFIIDSKYKVNNFTVTKLINRTNSITFFDTNSLSDDSLSEIKRTILEKSSAINSIIVIFSHQNDNKVSDYFERFDIYIPVIRLSNKFVPDEIDEINPKAYQLKLPKFEYRKTILDNVYETYKYLGQTSYINSVILSKELFLCLYLIGIQGNSATGETLLSCGISRDEVINLTKKHHPFLELERVTIYEQEEHSGFKLTCNSKAWLFSIMHRFYKERKLEYCIDLIMFSLSKLIISNRSVFIKGYLFDTINDLFSYTSNRNWVDDTGVLIIALYDKMDARINNEPEFHVQRSKAYCNMFRDVSKIEKIDNVITNLKFAKSYSSSESTLRNINHQLALIHLKKSKLLNFKIDKNHLKDTLTYCFNCINESTSNSSHVGELLSGSTIGGRQLDELMAVIPTNKDLNIIALTMKDKYEFIMSRKMDYMRTE